MQWNKKIMWKPLVTIVNYRSDLSSLNENSCILTAHQRSKEGADESTRDQKLFGDAIQLKLRHQLE